MSFKATFYTFSKKLNSTKQPTGTGTQYDIVIKSGSSIINPTIELQLPIANNPTALNYCHIADFGRYYFVHDWVFTNRLWVAQLTADPMASFKTNIGSYSGYILRSASTSNGRVVDNLYPAKAQNTHDSSTITTPLDGSCYILGIMGKDSTANEGGAVRYYRATEAACKALINYMLDDPSIYSVSDISSELLKCLFNPLQYIVSCMWFPITPPVSSGDVNFGWWSIPITGMSPLSALDWGSNFSISVPKHPKAATRGQYLNMPPFSSYKLEAGPWGIIPLDNFNLLDATNLDCNYKVDLMTGSGRLDIKFRDKVIHESIHTTQIGVPVQLGQNMFNQGALMSTIEHSVSSVKAAASLNPGGLLTEGLAAIGDAAQLRQSVPSTLGSNGTKAFNNLFGISADFLDIVDEDNTSRGRPLCEVKTISSLSGYILCSDADPDIPGTDTELSQIVSYMNGGFYYE